RLAGLDLPAAQDRILVFLGLSPRAHRRVRDNEGGVEAVFARAAVDAVALLARSGPQEAGARLAGAIAEQPAEWGRWASAALPPERRDVARAALAFLPAPSGPAWTMVLRKLADAADDAEAFRATFTPEALRTPAV